METAESTTSYRGLFGTKVSASVAFLAGLLIFLLPFAQVKCNEKAFAENTGVGIAMGSEWKEVKSNSFFGHFGQGTEDTKNNEKQDPNTFAIASIFFGILGLIFSMINFKPGYAACALMGTLAAFSLIGMLVDLKSQVKDNSTPRPGGINLNAGDILTVDATVWFYMAVIAFLLAAIFSWQGRMVKTG